MPTEVQREKALRMIEISDRVALRVSPMGRVQVARQEGGKVEVIAEFDFGQLETVIRWISQAMTAWASSHLREPEPPPWFGADPRAVSGKRRSGGNSGVGPLFTPEDEVASSRKGSAKQLRLGPVVPVEALEILSRLPRERQSSELFSNPSVESDDGALETHRPSMVDGFAGFKWGTRQREIPDLAWMDPAGETREGILFYVTYTKLVNETGFAAYYVDPLTEELIGGAYVFSPPLEHWEATWYAITDSLRTGYPELSMSERVYARRSEPRRRVVYADEHQDDVVSVSMSTATGIPLLHVLYRSHKLIQRQVHAIREDQRKLGPVGADDPDSVPLQIVRDAKQVGEE